MNKLAWKRKKQFQKDVVVGRKNHGVSFCAGFIHVSAGVDANKNMLSDYMIYDNSSSQWNTLKLKRSKYEKDESIDAVFTKKNKKLDKTTQD